MITLYRYNVSDDEGDKQKFITYEYRTFDVKDINDTTRRYGMRLKISKLNPFPTLEQWERKVISAYEEQFKKDNIKYTELKIVGDCFDLD